MTIFKLQVASPQNEQTILDISILLKRKDVREKNRKTALRTLNRVHAVWAQLTEMPPFSKCSSDMTYNSKNMS